MAYRMPTEVKPGVGSHDVVFRTQQAAVACNDYAVDEVAADVGGGFRETHIDSACIDQCVVR